MKYFRLRPLLSALTSSTALIAASIGHADSPDVVTMPVIVGDASASAATSGGASRMEFTLTNEGRDNITLLRVKSRVAESAKFVARIDQSNTAVLEALSVPAGDTARLNTSHLWIELCALTEDLSVDKFFPATLVFARGEIDIDVHVHATGGAAYRHC